MKALKESLGSVINQALSHDVATAISYWVGNDVGELLSDHVGFSDARTVYDLASLTKILGTTLALARACSDGIISLDERPFNYNNNITVKHLLAHTSGLPAHIKFYLLKNISLNKFLENKKIMFEALEPIIKQSKPNSPRLYSDLNFLALGSLLEGRYKKPLEEIFRQTWQKFEINTNLTHFVSGVITEQKNVAPTGWCKFRGQHLRAQVHDLNCFFLGGLAGHAGLFGDIASVAAVGQFLLKSYKKPNNPYREMVRYFIQNSLGFDRPTKNGSIRFLHPASFGHFGFTGTSLWIDTHADKDQGLIYILLTNRVEKSERPEPIFGFREKFHRLF